MEASQALDGGPIPLTRSKKQKEKMTESHQQGHRQRLRERFINAGSEAIADYELLEMILFGANPRKDVKPLAKDLLTKFGNFNNIINAEVKDLMTIPGLGDTGIALLKAVRAACSKLLKENIIDKPILSSWADLFNYCCASMSHLKIEQFRLIFLDRKHRVLSEEVQQQGTVDNTPVYPREVVKRALDLGASGIILVHNHPTGDPTPSAADIDMTKRIKSICIELGIQLHDHIIIGKGKHTSFKAEGLL